MYDIRVTGEQPGQRGSEGCGAGIGGAGIGGGCDGSGIGGGDARRRASAVLVRSLACTS